jgi:plastocyanin
MKKYIFFALVLFLLIFVSCKKATITAPSNQQAEAAEAKAENPGADEVPEEWKGKTIKDIVGTTNLIQNDTQSISSIESSNETEEEPSTPVPEGTTIIELRKLESSMVFFPKDVTINIGETVRWVNKLDYLNKQAKVTIYSYLTGKFRSEEISYGEYFDHTFNETGNFTYNALPYQTMFKKGTVVVK